MDNKGKLGLKLVKQTLKFLNSMESRWLVFLISITNDSGPRVPFVSSLNRCGGGFCTILYGDQPPATFRSDPFVLSGFRASETRLAALLLDHAAASRRRKLSPVKATPQGGNPRGNRLRPHACLLKCNSPHSFRRFSYRYLPFSSTYRFQRTTRFKMSPPKMLFSFIIPIQKLLSWIFASFWEHF